MFVQVFVQEEAPLLVSLRKEHSAAAATRGRSHRPTDRLDFKLMKTTSAWSFIFYFLPFTCTVGATTERWRPPVVGQAQRHSLWSNIKWKILSYLQVNILQIEKENLS